MSSRCPDCDRLISSPETRCPCGYVFSDDVPVGTLTKSRTAAFLGSLIFSAGLGYLGRSMLLGSFAQFGGGFSNAVFTLSAIALFGLSLGLSILRKSGGLYLGTAMVFVFFLAWSTAGDVVKPRPLVTSTPIHIPYDPDIKLSMGNVDLEMNLFDVEEQLDRLFEEDHIEVSTPQGLLSIDCDETGLVEKISGLSLIQDGRELLKPGDLSRRIQRTLDASLHGDLVYLTARESVLVQIVDDKVQEISLVRGNFAWKSTDDLNIDGVGLGMGEDYALYLWGGPGRRGSTKSGLLGGLRDHSRRPRYVGEDPEKMRMVLGNQARSVVGVFGHELKKGGRVLVKTGQPKTVLMKIPELTETIPDPPIHFQLDRDGVIRGMARGQLAEELTREPVMPLTVAKKFDLIFFHRYWSQPEDSRGDDISAEIWLHREGEVEVALCRGGLRIASAFKSTRSLGGHAVFDEEALYGEESGEPKFIGPSDQPIGDRSIAWNSGCQFILGNTLYEVKAPSRELARKIASAWATELAELKPAP